METVQHNNKSSNVATILWLIFFFPVGLYFLWAKTNWNTKIKWGITGLFAFFVLMGAIGNSGSSSGTSETTTTAGTKEAAQQSNVAPTKIPGTPTPTTIPTVTPTPVPTDANGFPMDYQTVTVADLDNSPSQYEGQKVMFTCTVAGFAKDSSGNAAAVNCSDPNDFSSMVQVATTAFDITKINQEDTVRFYGFGEGSASGKNAFGGDVSESVVTGLNINDLTSGYKE